MLIPLDYFQGLVYNHFCWLPSLSIIAHPLDSIKEFLSPFFLVYDLIKDIILFIINDYWFWWINLIVVCIFYYLFKVGNGDDRIDVL